MDSWRERTKERLAGIKNTNDFMRIFDEEFAQFIGSPRNCADTLRGLTPLEKQPIADRAITTLRNRFPGTRWYYAGD